jgi:hypothetical protein
LGLLFGWFSEIEKSSYLFVNKGIRADSWGFDFLLRAVKEEK